MGRCKGRGVRAAGGGIYKGGVVEASWRRHVEMGLERGGGGCLGNIGGRSGRVGGYKELGRSVA